MIQEHPYYWDDQDFYDAGEFEPVPPASWNRVTLRQPGQVLREWADRIRRDFDATFAWYPLLKEPKVNGFHPCVVASDNDDFLFLARMELG